MPSPRVTLGIATYERDTYLAEAIASCLAQDYDDYEVLVVLDGGRNPRVDEIVASFDDPRLRVVRHDVNKGIAEAYNTIVREGRGELIGILGDDDVAEPDRLSRSVAVFDRHPDTGDRPRRRDDHRRRPAARPGAGRAATSRRRRCSSCSCAATTT